MSTDQNKPGAAPGGSSADSPPPEAERSAAARGPEGAAGVSADRGTSAPLSFAQRRLWVLEQFDDVASAHNLPRYVRLRGALDEDALRRALNGLVARHDALRTTYHGVEGVPEQRIAPAGDAACSLAVQDLTDQENAEAELRRLLAAEMEAPFDLRHGPLFRSVLFRLAPDEHVLLLTMHHIVSDGWSLAVLAEDLGALYASALRGEGDPLPPLPVPYAEYVARQRRDRTPELVEAKKQYLREALAGAPPLLELPTDHPRPARQQFGGGSLPVQLDEALTAGLKALAERNGTTLFRTLLAAWAVVVGRLSGQDDVLLGVPMANRDGEDARRLVGIFVDTVVVRVDLSGSPTVAGLLERVHRRTREARQHQDVPFEDVVSMVAPVRSLAWHPVYQTGVSWTNVAKATLSLPGVAPAALEGPPRTAVAEDVFLVLHEDAGRIAGRIDYARALFERETVERYVGYLRRVLEGMVADDRRTVERLPLMSGPERLQVVGTGDRTAEAHPAGACVHELFESQAARTPDAVAVLFDDERLTYAELDARANRLAHHLRTQGVERGAAVGVCLEWRPELVVALLATLKAGGVYVPLDPSLPPGRLAYIAEDAGVRAVVTRAGLADRVPLGAAVRVDVDAEDGSTAPAEAPRSRVCPADLAYVIYTSGSTGLPKGVAVEHGAAAAHLVMAAREHGIVAEDRVLQFASAGFDVSLEQVFSPLLTGATLVLRGAELWSAAEFVSRVRALGITVADLPPAYWLEVMEGAAQDALAGVRLILLGGEAVPSAAADGRGAGRLVNCYGPTEAVITATAFEMERGAAGGAVVPIGRPHPGRSVYVLDRPGAPVPVGVGGELYIGGGLLARGYLGRPALTAERFVPDPFGAAPGGRLYRTGDRVRWNASGNLEFLGRTDFQVKIRGFRIELGEIEAALRSHQAVRDAAVLAREDAAGEKRLVAYVVGDAGVDAQALRAHLSERLPEYMVPAAYVRLDTLPLTPNGKVDRKALPAPEGDAFATRAYEAPAGGTEQAVAAIWAELLGTERVGRHDHFFESGGHSLLAVRVVSRVRHALGVHAAPADLFERPVLADFAGGLKAATPAEGDPIGRVDRSTRIPLSFAQQRLWFLEQLGNLGSTYHIPVRLRLRGGLDRIALARALDRVVARHEALRTTFPAVDGQPVQRIAPVEESAFRLVEHDFLAASDADDRLRRLMTDEASALFHLARGPLIRGRLVRMAEDDHVLLLTMHHIVSDGWSAGVLYRELGTLYAAFVRGEADPLPPLPVQYADYAAWHRRRADGPVLEAQAEYWTEALAGAPELLALPADHPRPARQDFAGASVPVELDEALAAGLRTLSQRHGTTLFVTLLAGWAAVLARLSGQDDLVIGTPSANRDRREVEELIGFFVNTLPVRVDLSGGPRVGELLERVKARALEAQRNPDIPFEQVVERVRPARSLAYSPLFQVMFAWQNAAGGDLELPGLTVGEAGAGGTDTAKFDLLLSLGERDGRIAGRLTYARSLFERETAERYAGYFRRVLEAMAADEGGRMDRVALLAAAEHDQVVHAWNRTAADVPRGACLPDLFEAQAARTPDADAVVFGDQSLSFAALNARANRLAHHLRALGVGPDARVGLCLERGVDAIVGLLGVLKAGGAYVPLDPSYPVERLRDMLADSAPVVLLTQASLRERAGSLGVPAVALDADAGAWAGLPERNPARAGLTPEHLAYVIYTSGSTGRPKGVMVRHGSVVNLASALQARIYAEHPSPLRVGVNAPLVFDGSVKQIVQLLSGHALCLVPDVVRRDPAALVAWLRSERVDALDMTPSLLRLALGAGLGRDGFPRFALVGGEAVDDELRERMSRVPTRFYNVYGPTECTVDVTARQIEAVGPAAAIGGPLPNVATYVLDPGLLPVPAGVAGELYVGGAGVARGYLNRPGTTAERFVPDPFGGEPGARLYRTGDRVRWREERAEVRECVSAEVGSGSADSRTDAPTHSRTAYLEYLGRLDVQVKVRGFRIELGEIETRLAEHPGVRQAVVLAREDTQGETRLVAYVVGGAPDAPALRAHLAERLPEYMVPAAYVRLDAFPVTTNGKVDRKALPAPEGDAFAARAYEAPVGEAEQAVAAIWAELLGAERIGRWDHFFESGGHSLLAVRVASRVRQALGVEAAPADLFERPVLADFARVLTAAAPAEGSAIERVDRGTPIPLSFAQQRLWFLEQLGHLGSTYHIPTGMRLRGALDRVALVRALDRIVARHEVLRTTFPAVGSEPVQRIASIQESAFRLVEHDLHASPDAEDRLHRVMSEEAGAPFDLEQGPLIRGRLVRMAADDHVLLLTMHHIVSDGWSAGVLNRELGALYAAFVRGETDPLPPLPVQYADYAAWHRRWVDGPVLEAQAEYWMQTLAGAPELLELPADHPRPARQDFAGASVEVELDEALTGTLKALGQRHGTTLFVTLLAGWATVLARLSGQGDVVIGTASANRGRAEVEELIGFFVNTLPVRIDLSDRPRVGELLDRAKARALEAQRNQDIPFEQVVERLRPVRSLAYSPLVQVMFAWQNAAGEGLDLPGLQSVPLTEAAQDTAKFDLSLALWERDGRIVGGVEYATALFERATVQRFAEYLRNVLAGMAADEAARVDRLALMPASERARVVEELNRTDAAYPAESCVHQLFEAQVERAPDAVAVVHEGEPLTYTALNARANRLAHHLRSLGVGPGAWVALAMKRSVELVEAELATLKCGGAYVPLDPEYPRERLRWMLADIDPAVLLTTRDFADRFDGLAVPVLALDEGSPAWASSPSTNVAVEGLTPEHLAYVMYTSGSTGRPKGVMVPHRGITRLVVDNGYAAFGPDDRVAFAANPAFDATTMEVWAPLVNGGRVVVIDHEVFLDPEAMARRLREQGVTALFVTTAVFNQYAATIPGALAGLRYLMTGGERADPASFARVLNAGGTGTLIHCYGPTETTTFAVTHPVRHVDEGASTVPLGGPIGNTRVYLLDEGGEPVPVGVTGELYIGGAGVARGYQGRPALTAEKFVPDPFGGAGDRLYRTGDLARWRAESAEVRECVSAGVDLVPASSRTDAPPHSRTVVLEFLGRNDHQVKVRGYRIEPGEIEARLLEHAAVREAIVVAREDAAGGRQLVAWYVAEGEVDVEALRAHVGERLPAYMVPAACLRLDALPLTPNGKVDRKALPAPEDDAYARQGYEAPLGETEQALAGIWSELLSVERVGRWDDFFQLGGHSLLAVQVTSRVRRALDAEIALRDVFAAPVLADLARAVDAAARAALPAIEPADRTGPLPLSFAQQRLWFLEQLGNLGSAYHVPMRLRLQGELDRDALRRALDRIVARHEALRTTFPAVGGEPVQRIASIEASAFRLVEHDLHAAPDVEDALRRITSDEATAPFDLAHGPLVRGRLVRMAPDDHVLLLTMHHIVSDGWSAGVLRRELGALYAALVRGEADPLPPLAVQYADYAAWHRRWADGPVLEAQAAYWTETLGGAPELLELSADHPRPARQNFAGDAVDVQLDEALTAALRTLSRRHGTTLFMTLLAGWAGVLARLSGQDDVVIGTPSANRGRAEVEGLIGFFVNMLPVRVELSDRPTVAELLARVKGRALEAQRNQDIPFEQVVERLRPTRSLAYTPLFQVMFAWQNAPGGDLKLPGLTVGGAAESAQTTAKFDLSLTLWEDGGRIAGGLNYATALFDRSTVERWAAYMRRALEEMAADEHRPVERLALLPADERALVLEAWNRTEAEYPAACVHELFRAQAARTPDAVALSWRGERLTYGELERRANRISHALRRRGAGPEVRIGICLPRKPDLVAAMLGVLGAGAAYVPLDPAYPRERLGYMLEDAAIPLVITDSVLADRLPESAAARLLLDRERAALAGGPDTAPESGVVPENLSHVIFTSGSTGRPKGVMIRHSAVSVLLHWMRDTIADEERASVLFSTSVNFDVSVAELFGTLCWGGTLVMVENALDLPTVADQGIRYVSMVPTAAAELLRTGGIPASVRTVNLGGEALPNELAQGLYALGTVEKVRNLYGPTEDTSYSTYSLVARGAEQVLIGTPLANSRAYVLDGQLQPVPVGAAGELYLAGDGLARGYANRPAMTAERFLPCPFGAPGARMYRAMDRVRRRADANGELEYLGRTDFQVKVRGFRIELGEIEARLLEHPAVHAAVVVARDDAAGGKRLVAYCVAGGAVEVEGLRAHLAERLPEYMVPAAYVRLETLPLTSSGKLDRKALPAPEDDAYARSGYEAPVGETEEVLAQVWSELLGVQRVGRWDHFFDLGGHSLLAMRVASRVSERVQGQVSATAVFYHPRLTDLARAVDEAIASHAGDLGDHDGLWDGGARTDLIDTFSVDMLSDDDVDAMLAHLLAEETGP